MLTVLQEKLAEAHALAIAAGTVVANVEQRVADPALRQELRALRDDADETRARCAAAEQAFGNEAGPELLRHLNTARARAFDLAGVWFKAGTGPLSAWTFLAMGEAAEVATWAVITELARREPDEEVALLAEWALPVQQRHLEVALRGAARLAEQATRPGPRLG